MNERIRDFDNELVDINCYHVGTRGLTQLTIVGGELRFNRGCGCQSLEIDAAGRDALIDALQCLRDTGSFAALADTSPIPFRGKRMLVNGNPVEILETGLNFANCCHCMNGDGTIVSTPDVEALTPITQAESGG